MRWPRDPTNAYLAKWGVFFAVPIVSILILWLIAYWTGWRPLSPE